MPEATTLEPERTAESGREEEREPREPVGERREREVVRDEPAEARVAAEKAGHPATPSSKPERLLPPSEAAELRRRWESIQTSFIDSPKESVEEADRLVADLSDRIATGCRAQRTELEARWHRGENISTEALRQSLQHYREFFDRLLHF